MVFFISNNKFTLFFKHFFLYLLTLVLTISCVNLAFSEESDAFYYFKKIDAKRAFVIVANDNNYTTQISNRVSGSLENIELKGDFNTMMNNLATAVQADWFKSGNNIFISHQSERLTRYIKLGPSLNSDSAIQIVQDTKLGTERFPIESSGAKNVISVNAPPKYIAILETVLLNDVEDKSPKSVGSVSGECSAGKLVYVTTIKRGTRKIVKRCSPK